MPDSPSRLQRAAARSIVTRYLRVRPGENAVVESWDHTMPLASAMVDEIRRAGGSVLLVHEDEDAWWRALDRKQSKLLGRSSAPEWAALKAADLYVNFWGPGDAPRIERTPERIFDEALAWNRPWYDVARKAGLRGVRMTVGFVTEGRARQWGVDRRRWEESVLRASLIDPEETAKTGRRVARSLAGGRRLRITHPNGTDLELALAGDAPRIYDGRPHARDASYGKYGMVAGVPGGRVDTALDGTTAEGRFYANRRTNIWWTWHTGASLEFSGGKLSAYALEQGEAEFTRQFRNGRTGKDRATGLKIGLHPVPRDVPNLEDIERGCVSVVLGGNETSNFMSWFSLAGAEIAVDGTPIVRAGRIL